VKQGDSSKLQRIAKLRIGLLVDSIKASKYVDDFVKWAKTQQDILVITHLILHDSKQAASNGKVEKNLLGKLFASLKNDGIYRTLSKALFLFIIKFEMVILRRHERYKDHFDTFDLSDYVPEQITINPIVSKSGFVYRFSADDIKRLKDLDLDILIRCGSGILRGDILRAAKFGIISFHHADNRINRGGPPAFWEVYYRQDTTGFTIQRLTEELDGGDALMRGHFQTSYYYLLNQAILFERSNHYLKLLVKKIAVSGGLPPFIPNVPYSNQIFRSPTAFQASTYILKLFDLVIRKAIRRAIGIKYRWQVAYTRSDWRNAALWRSSKIENPPSHFLADPFVVSKNGKDFCFVEEFDFRSDLGKIAVYELTSSHAIRIGTALEEVFHLSFPYLFEFQQQLYMCPETSKNRDIRIYKCVDFPLRWELENIVMKDVSAADTMFFELNGKWWMLTNTDPVGDGDYCSELLIFHSDSPFGKYWTPHPLNPIIVDAGRARNAGLIKDGNSYFRVSQGQGFDVYGKITLINEIIELTESNYVEITRSVISSAFQNGAVGTHHLHSNGNVTVFDFVATSRMPR
jgi:hypothetical protein